MRLVRVQAEGTIGDNSSDDEEAEDEEDEEDEELSNEAKDGVGNEVT